MPREIAWLLVPIVLIGFGALAFSDVRKAYLNGWRCLARYPALWKIPLWFTLAYTGFQIAGQFLFAWRSDAAFMPFAGISEVPLPAIVRPALLPASESLAATLNCLVATFPLSAVGGLLFVCNYRGLSGELILTLRKSFGAKGSIFSLLLILSALCAMLKPLLLIGLPEVIAYVSFPHFFLAACTVNAFSFIFEYLLGTCLQVYLVLLACGWIRGSLPDSAKLMRFAVRRLGSVFRWAAVVIAATLLLLHLPMLAATMFTGLPTPFEYEIPVRVFLAVLMVALASVQMRLILHNETLAQAFRAHLGFLRARARSSAVFLLAAFLSLWLAKALEIFCRASLGDSVAAAIAGATAQASAAALGGWILASWTCFYKGGSRISPEIAF